MRTKLQTSTAEIAFLLEAGIVYRDAHEFKEAETIFRGVRELTPSSEIPDIALGTLRFEQGDLPGAVKHYNQALEKNPQSAWGHSHMGEAQLFLRAPAEARQHLQRAIALDPQGETGKFARGLIELLGIVEQE
jgi:tetratricopeptide (TPR) repeat protein